MASDSISSVLVASSNSSAPLLTREMIDEWRRERETALAEKAKIEKRIEELSRKLEAAAVFVGSEILNEPEKRNLSTDESLIGGGSVILKEHTQIGSVNMAIISALEKSPEGLTPRDIQEELSKNAEFASKLEKSHSNYIYNILARLVDKRKLKRVGGRYYISSS